MRFLNIKQFADLKKCSRENIYNANRKGEVDINRSAGFPVIFLNEKNISWKPKGKGRPRRESIDSIVSEINKKVRINL